MTLKVNDAVMIRDDRKWQRRRVRAVAEGIGFCGGPFDDHPFQMKLCPSEYGEAWYRIGRYEKTMFGWTLHHEDAERRKWWSWPIIVSAVVVGFLAGLAVAVKAPDILEAIR